MISRSQKLAIYMEGELVGDFAKMCYGILRYSPNEVAAIIDSEHTGQDVKDLVASPRSAPVVADINAALELGADVLVLGIAAPGGHIPSEWLPAIDEAVQKGMCIANGLHDRLASRFPNLKAGQWIWDMRVEPEGLSTGTGAATSLANRRVLMIGTDMSIGKMTAGLELYRGALQKGVKAEFVATGQIGITITGRGIPLDAVRVDYASGAMEREMLATAKADLVIVEGQGALIHPGSTANLPLLRGSCPTHLVLCHRAGQQTLRRLPHIKIPPLSDYIRLYEDLAEACGTFPRPKAAAIAVNTSHLGAQEAVSALQEIEQTTGITTDDPVRNGPDRLLESVLKP
jgi:uncharacterized NAD-dependent epimerase/dehydratase family protein